MAGKGRQWAWAVVYRRAYNSSSPPAITPPVPPLLLPNADVMTDVAALRPWIDETVEGLTGQEWIGRGEWCCAFC